MKNVLKSLKNLLLMKNSQRLCLFSNGGNLEYYLIIGGFYSLLTLYNLIQMSFRGDSVLSIIGYTLPFFIFSILIFSKIRDKTDILIDSLLCLILMIVEGSGRFSGAVFSLLVIFRIKNSKYLIFFLLSMIIAITTSSVLFNRSIISTFLLLFLYLIIGFKYYWIIHLPTEKLRSQIIDQSSTISELKRKLSVLGSPKGLTKDQILDMYPFMSHTSDNPYRKIDDLILLASGIEYKEIAGMNDILNIQTVSNQFGKMRESVGKVVNRDIPNNTALIFACSELNILKLNYTHLEKI